MQRRTGLPLIGREHPADVLRAEISRAAASHGGLVLVTGEAGIGKTTLVSTVAEEARDQDMLVLSGSCWDSDAAPGYWPWIQVARKLRRASTQTQWRSIVDAAGDGLLILLGEASGAERFDDFPLYDSVTTALVATAQARPVMVMLDDLHWADAASLKLLEFAAQHTWFERLLLVGTYRDVEVESDEHPLRSRMAQLVAKATTVTLTGLSPVEVGELIGRTAGERASASAVDEVHRKTGGNPFFVEQAARLWRSGGSITATPPGVRDALRRRLALLPSGVGPLLTTASVLGREFHRKVLAATVAAPVAQVDQLLDQAVAARLVVALGAGRFSFAHDLVRQALYDTLDDPARRTRHAAVVHALNRNSSLTGDVLPAELARHAYLAAAEFPADRAVELLLSAARNAAGRMATDETITHYRRAHERAADQPAQRLTIALSLASELHHHGDHEESWQYIDEAVATARDLGRGSAVARAALTVYWMDTPADRTSLPAELLTEAYTLLHGGTPPDDQLPLDQLAKRVADDVVTSAREGGDDEELTFGLWALHNTIWGAGSAAERAALTDELVTIARRSADAETEHYAASFKWVALLEQGDPAYLDQYHAFARMTEGAELASSRLAAVADRCIISALLGRFDDSQRSLDQLAESFSDTHPHAGFMLTHLRWALLTLRGAFDDLAAVHDELASGDRPHRQLIEGITAAQRGDAGTAQRLADIAAETSPFPSHFEPLLLRLRAQAAAAARDDSLCEQARNALTPMTRHWLVSLYGCDIGGPAEHWLGVLDVAQRRWDAAIANFTTAYESAERLRALPWSLHARAGLAEALLARCKDGDDARARSLLDDVERAAAEIGMRHVVDHVRALREAEPDCGRTPAKKPAAEFRRTGAVWSLSFDGSTVHLPDAKGLRDLHTLLSNPGVDLPAVELLDPAGGTAVVAARRLGGDPMLDEEAKAQYRRRLHLLDARIDDAVELGQDAKAAAFDEERAALLAQLRTATGLAGRTRRLGDEAERARKTVTARIRDVLRKLDERHHTLAEHLRATVSTGASCRYQPTPDVHWRL